MDRFYLDTSILLDIAESRGENGKGSVQMMEKIIKMGATIIFSDLHFMELSKLGYSVEEIYRLFRIVKPANVRRVHLNRRMVLAAKNVAKKRQVPFGDALHAVLSRDAEAILISRDRHFQKLKDISECKRPEDV